jgi:hypothetical protein
MARNRSGAATTSISAPEASVEDDAAMALPHKAVVIGYRSLEAYRTADALEPLRDRDDFKLLLLDLAFLADPFSRGE